MKKLIAALAICVGTAAFAGDTNLKAQNAQQAQQEKERDATQVFTQKPGDSIKESKRDAEEGIDATQVGPKIGKAAKDVTGVQTEDEGTFKTARAFSMRGKIKDTTLEGVTIERSGLPAADLDVRDKTMVWLDGKKVKVDALPEGAQVRAKFQLEGQDIVAVELRATSPKGIQKKPAARPSTGTMKDEGTGGSGMPQDDATRMEEDVRDEARDIKSDVREDTNEMRDDVNESLK